MDQEWECGLENFEFPVPDSGASVGPHDTSVFFFESDQLLYMIISLFCWIASCKTVNERKARECERDPIRLNQFVQLLFL